MADLHISLRNIEQTNIALGAGRARRTGHCDVIAVRATGVVVIVQVAATLADVALSPRTVKTANEV